MTTGVGGSNAERELASLRPFRTRAPHITKQERVERLARLRARMEQDGIDAMVLVAGANLRYFLGVPWGQTERLVGAVVTASAITVVCPKFEDTALEPVLQMDAERRFWEEDEDPNALVAAIMAGHGVAAAAVDPNCPLWLFDRLRKAAASVEMHSGEPVTTTLRAIKSPAELALLREAKQMTLEVHGRAARILHPGIRPSEVRAFIDHAHRAIGGDGGSTFCAVQFGAATAHPHGVPGDPPLQENELVLIDTGCTVDGYHSDITRTYAFGEVSARAGEIWEIEKEAQRAAFDAVRPGVACAEIDRAARDVLEKYHLGPDYRLPGLPHRTGHGIGLDIHEAPYLVCGDQTPLAPGMCFSNEPMIVVPEEFGVRLEDHFYVTETGAAWFTEPQHSMTEPFGA